MKKVFGRYRRKFWETVIVYASIPALIAVFFKYVMPYAVWMAVVNTMLIAGYVTYRLYRRYLLRR